MAGGGTEAEVPHEPLDPNADPSRGETRSSSELSAPMLDVHAPHQAVHTWKDFLVHIAAITIGLLIALGLEATVEWLHHRHQAQQALELLKQEVDQNRLVLKSAMQSNEVEERNHHEDLAVLRRLRAGSLEPNDHIVYVRGYESLGSSAWKIVHESNAAAYLSFELIRRYENIYDSQTIINETANAVYVKLQEATSVFNSEDREQSGNDKERIQEDYYSTANGRPDVISAEQMSAFYSGMSGKQDLSRLTPGQIDRLEQGFQQAITDDRRLRRMYIYLEDAYATLAK